MNIIGTPKIKDYINRYFGCNKRYVFRNDETNQVVVMGLIDNLGKGASGQVVQNMNLMIGAPQDFGF